MLPWKTDLVIVWKMYETMVILCAYYYKREGNWEQLQLLYHSSLRKNKYKAMQLNRSLKNRSFLILSKTAFITKGTISITVLYNYLKHWQKIDFKWKRNFKWESSPRLKQWCKEKPRTLVKGENVGEGVWEEDLRKLPKHTIYTRKP